MTAYGRKQTLRLSLNGCFLTAALEKKADIRVLELRARVNGMDKLTTAECNRLLKIAKAFPPDVLREASRASTMLNRVLLECFYPRWDHKGEWRVQKGEP